MGFYSFYRIFKDVVRSLFGSKGWKFFLILLIVIIILGLKNNVFAANDVPEVPSEYDQYVLTKDVNTNGSTSYVLWVANSNVYGNLFYYLDDSDGVQIDYKISSSDSGYGGSFTYYIYNSSSKTFNKAGSLDYVLYYSTHPTWNITRSLISASYKIYDVDKNEDIYIPPIPIVQPSFISTVEDLESEQNSYLKINQGSFMDSIYLRLYNNTTNSLLFESKLTSYEDYMVRENLEDPFSNLIYSIPYSALPSFKLISGNNFEYRLVYRNENNELSSVSMYFTPSITQEVNGVSDKEINDSIKETNDSIKDMNNTIKDTSDKLFSDEYDESKINISTAESDKVDDTQITNFVTSLLQNIQNIATGNWNNVEIISFDLRFCG